MCFFLKKQYNFLFLHKKTIYILEKMRIVLEVVMLYSYYIIAAVQSELSAVLTVACAVVMYLWDKEKNEQEA